MVQRNNEGNHSQAMSTHHPFCVLDSRCGHLGRVHRGTAPLVESMEESGQAIVLGNGSACVGSLVLCCGVAIHMDQ